MTEAEMEMAEIEMDRLCFEIEKRDIRIAELETALNAARVFIEDQFREAEAQEWGEFLSCGHARRVHKIIVDALHPNELAP